MRPSEKAWLGLAAGVLAYEVACPSGETLSEGVDGWLEHENRAVRYGTHLVIGATALHLANIFTRLNLDAVDPYHQLTRLKGLRKD